MVLLIVLTIKPGICSPAFPGKVKVNDYKGTSMMIQLMGDENNKFARSEDGYLLFPMNDTWYYMTKRDDRIVPTEYKLGEILSLRKDTIEKFVRTENYSGLEINSGKNRTYRKKTIPARGTHHALVILMQYADLQMRKSHDEFERLFNVVGYKEDGAYGSVRDYFAYASYNQLDMVCDVYGPFTASKFMSYYGGNLINGNDNDPLSLIIEAIEALPANIDFSIYDSDDDGYIDNVHVIFAGYGEEAGASSSAIWSHEYPHTLPLSKNGYKFNGYSCTPELRGNIGSGISRIGVICHEITHSFGVMDYYDVNYETLGSFDGTGQWDLMASGSWNNEGISPANINPYAKIYDLGWITPQVIKNTDTYTIRPFNYTGEVAMINTQSIDDYYLAECRIKDSFDSFVPGEGLLIYHVHPQINITKKSNSINSTHPQGLYPVCASYTGCPIITKKYGDINSAGCPFPGTSGQHCFSENSEPKAFAWNQQKVRFEISDIYLNNEGVVFSYDRDGENPPIQYDDLYFEGFEEDNLTFAVTNETGVEEWKVYPLPNTLVDVTIPTPYEGKRLLGLFDERSPIVSVSEIISRKVEISSLADTYMSFAIRNTQNYRNESPTVQVFVNYDEESDWKQIDVFDSIVGSWSIKKYLLDKGHKYVSVKIKGAVKGNGAFIDNFKIEKNTDHAVADLYTNIDCISVTKDGLCITTFKDMPMKIFNLSGSCVYNEQIYAGVTTYIRLTQGIYIICTPDRNFTVVIK